MYEKSSRLSAAYREKGNASYKNRDFFEALVFYNKALAFAESKEDLSLAYANRGTVYLEVNKYDLCLQNIKWARENNYQKSQVLTDREGKCKKRKQADKQKAQESFFKLSYPANPKIPFIVENLYMKETPEFGRGIYATTDLKTGDVIAIETPAVTVLYNDDDARYKHCCYCMKSGMMNLIPCLKSVGLMYCSKECQKRTYQISEATANLIADSPMKTPEKIQAIIQDFFNSPDDESLETLGSDNYPKTVFDFDFSDPKDENYKKNLGYCLLGLNAKSTVNKIRQNFENHFSGIIAKSGSSMQYKKNQKESKLVSHGAAYLVFGGLLNHSCDPNVGKVDFDGKVAFIILKPIKANEQIFNSYIPDFFVNQNVQIRRQTLMFYEFHCKCDACEYNYNFMKLVELATYYTKPLYRLMPKVPEKAVRELKDNCKYIQDHAYNILTLENYELIHRNAMLLSFLAYLETFPC